MCLAWGPKKGSEQFLTDFATEHDLEGWRDSSEFSFMELPSAIDRIGDLIFSTASRYLRELLPLLLRSAEDV